MKKAQIKSVLILSAVFILMITIVLGLSISINYPGASEWSTEAGSTRFSWNASGDYTIPVYPWCGILYNYSGSYGNFANYTYVVGVDENFEAGLGLNDSGSIFERSFRIVCFNGSDEVESSNVTFGVDKHWPVISISSPSNWEYSSDDGSTATDDGLNGSSDNLTFVPSDTVNDTLETCDVYTNISGSWAVNYTFLDISSGLSYMMNLNGTADGHYIWNVMCNQTSTNRSWAAPYNYTLVIDTSGTGVVIRTPANNTVGYNNTFYVAWNESQDANFDKYELYASTDITDLEGTSVMTDVFTASSSNSSYMRSLLTNRSYYLWVRSYDLAGWTVNSTVVQYNVDNDTIVISDYSPSNDTHYGFTSPINFNVTVTDENADVCQLFLSNSSQQSIVLNKSELVVNNNVELNLTPSLMNEGTYLYNIVCNDSLGRKINLSATDLTVTVDLTAPGLEPNITSPWTMRNSTDTTTTLYWQTSSDTHFEKYAVTAWYIDNGSIGYQINVTTESTNSTELTLQAGHTYNFTVEAYDEEGHFANSSETNTVWYYVDDNDNCGTLYEGWNVCGWIEDLSKNLTVIAAETGASFVSVWNKSHEWHTCTPGAVTTNCDAEVSLGYENNSAVWVYVAADTTWNRTWVSTKDSANITLWNSTNGWNLISMFARNGRTFTELNASTRFPLENISMVSLRYNNGSDAVSHITQHGWSYMSEDTLVNYGQALWVYFNGSVAGNYTVERW